MEKMLDNCSYDKHKLVHELSSICWFVNKHCHRDAQEAQDKECQEYLKKLEEDLCKHIHELQQMCCK